MSNLINFLILGVGVLIFAWIIVSARKSSKNLSNKKIKTKMRVLK